MSCRYRAWLGILVLAIVVAGCARGRLSHEPGLVTDWDHQPFPAMAQPPELSLILHTRHLMFHRPSSSPVSKWWSTHKVRKQLNDVMGEFPFLGRAQWEATAAPYQLEIEATHAIQGSSFRSSLSSMTKYIIPASETGVIELEAWLSRDGQPLKTYEAVGNYTIKRHLIFLILPWMWGKSVPSDTIEDTFRDLFLQIQRDAATLQWAK